MRCILAKSAREKASASSSLERYIATTSTARLAEATEVEAVAPHSGYCGTKPQTLGTYVLRNRARGIRVQVPKVRASSPLNGI